MDICKTENEYIEKVALAAQKACKRYGYLASILIAQSCRENGYGIPSYWDNTQIEALLKYNNMVGIKSDLLTDSWADKSVWPGKSLSKKTPEVYDGKKVTVDDDFRKYDDIEQSFADYLLFMKYGAYTKGGKPKYGDAVLNMKDPAKLIQKVKALGYATGPTYATNVMKIVNKHNLTKYDNLDGVQPTIYTPGYRKTATIQKTKKLEDRQIIDITARNKSMVPHKRYSNPSEHDYKIQFIVCHYLGVPNADNPDLYESGGTKGYGGHYNIERNGKVYKAANPKTAVVWQCGGGRQGSVGGSFFGICTNYNSIGIECGVCYTDKSAKEGDGDSTKWYFTEETQESLVWLVSKLMDEYNISFDHVIRHYDVTGKICPNPYVKNNGKNGNWTWTEFKNNLKQYRQTGSIIIPDRSVDPPAPDPKPTPTPPSTILRRGDRGDAVKTMQKMLIKCGYSCGKSGADGDFGENTLTAVKAFQKASGLAVDGLYGAKSKAALEAAYKALTAKKETAASTSAANVFLAAVKNVADTARKNGWTYGDSHATPPCSDKIISCDRLEARALYDLGYTDQRQGGETCGTFPTWLPAHGWKKVTKKSEIKSGAIVAVKAKTQSYINHVFTVVSYDAKTDRCTKYDTGSNERIKTVQPFKNVALVEWPEREFVCAWNVPDDLKGATPKKEESKISGTTFNGVNYQPVYNYNYYKNKYADLRKAFGTDKNAYFRHFCEYGMKEGRQAASAFNVTNYKKRYADLRKAFGENLPEYYKHYCLYGKKENRSAK